MTVCEFYSDNKLTTNSNKLINFYYKKITAQRQALCEFYYNCKLTKNSNK